MSSSSRARDDEDSSSDEDDQKEHKAREKRRALDPRLKRLLNALYSGNKLTDTSYDFLGMANLLSSLGLLC